VTSAKYILHQVRVQFEETYWPQHDHCLMRLHPADINIYPFEVSMLYTRNFKPAD